MKFELKNVGLIDDASIDIANLTILCGENNTGKTYVTYAIYGFLRIWRQFLFIQLRSRFRDALEDAPNGQLDLDSFFHDGINGYLKRFGKQYGDILADVFASRKDLFPNAEINVSVPSEIDYHEREYHRAIKDSSGTKTIATLRKTRDSHFLEVLVAGKSTPRSRFELGDFTADAVADIVFAPYLPEVFIASAERTGAAIFRRELDFARTRLVEALGRSNGNESLDLFRLPTLMDVGYPWPVRDNVEFVRRLEIIDREISVLVAEYPDIMDKFNTVLGGSYKVVKDKGIYYQPKGSRKPRLSMSESSSSVRALLDIGFYLRCIAKPGDLLMIDEPELNLHPVNQRAFARLIAYLVNCGVKVFMTTHSDYIIKELNTLIMLNPRTDRTKAIQQKYGYGEEELIDPAKIRLFVTCTAKPKGKRTAHNTLRQAPVHPDQGIEVDTFDVTIDEMNAIQSEILFGGDL